MKQIIIPIIFLCLATGVFADTFTSNASVTIDNTSVRFIGEGVDKTYPITNTSIRYNETLVIDRVVHNTSTEVLQKSCENLSTLSVAMGSLLKDTSAYYGLYVNATNELSSCETNLSVIANNGAVFQNNSAALLDCQSNTSSIRDRVSSAESEQRSCNVLKNNFETQYNDEKNQKYWVGGVCLAIGAGVVYFINKNQKPKGTRQEHFDDDDRG